MSDAYAKSLSEIHTAAFQTSRGWSRNEIAGLLASPHVFTVTRTGGFAIGRVVVDEAELLTIAVTPSAQGRGLGTELLLQFEQAAATKGAIRAFLEVAADNLPAVAIYQRTGWETCGLRPAYYTRPDGSTCDAILMEKHLT